MKRREFLPMLLVGSLGLAPSLYSQETGGGKIRLRLLAFGPEQRMETVFIHDPASLPETPAVSGEIKSYLNHESLDVVTKSRKLIFTREKDRKSLDKPESLVGEITLPANVSSAIVLFLPGKISGQTKPQVIVVDDSVKSFPVGSYWVTNLSAQLVRIELEDKPFEFKSATSSLIVDPPVRANNHSGMRAFALTNKEWLPIASSLWPHPGRSRSLLVLFPNPMTGTVNLRAFGDVPPRAPNPSVAG